MFVGFGGSSGTGLYLSGCTTPDRDKSRERIPTYPPSYLPAGLLSLMLPSTLTADALSVADFSTADGIVVLLVAHQRVHAQDRWRRQTEGHRS